jgi:Sulfotransferase domain
VRLPDFICVGPGRTGTTWLHAALSGHVGLPARVKETRFWGKYYYQGIGWYADNFRHCDPSLPVGEACPYFSTDNARERIARHLPRCKIIVTLRDPVDRSYSQYRTLRKMGLARGSFEEELSHPRIVTTNRYAYHLRGWIELFGAKNVLILRFDDLQTNPQKFLDQVCDFIGIGHIALETKTIRDREINSYKYLPRSRRTSRRIGRLIDYLHEKRAYRVMNFLEAIGFWDFMLTGRRPFPPLAPATELRLREQLLPEIEEVEALTGFDLKAWKEPSARVNRWREGLERQRPSIFSKDSEIARSQP